MPYLGLVGVEEDTGELASDGEVVFEDVTVAAEAEAISCAIAAISPPRASALIGAAADVGTGGVDVTSEVSVA